MRRLVVASALLVTAGGCQLLIDTSELVPGLEGFIGDASDDHRLYPTSMIEGRGALAGSQPNLILLRGGGIEPGDRVKLSTSLGDSDCLPPDSGECNAVGSGALCCLGPFVGPESGLGAVLVRIGAFEESLEETNPQSASLEILRDGSPRGRTTFRVVELPELDLLEGGTYDVDDIYTYRPDGNEPYSMFSRIEIGEQLRIGGSDDFPGPARLVATTELRVASDLNVQVLAGSGAAEVQTAPELSGTEGGAIGLFADSLILEHNPEPGMPRYDADAVLFRGALNESDLPDDYDLCTNFSSEFQSAPVESCPDLNRVLRFDTTALCYAANGSDEGIACDEASESVVLTGSSLSPRLQVGPRIEVSHHVVTSDTLDELKVAVIGAGNYAWTHDNQAMGRQAGVIGGFGSPPSSPDESGPFLSRRQLDLELGPGFNIICARSDDGATQSVSADTPEMGMCVEILHLP